MPFPTGIDNPPENNNYDDKSNDEDLSIYDENDLLELFNDSLSEGILFSNYHVNRARLNEQFVNGNQFIGTFTRNDQFFVQEAWFNDVPRKSKPILRNFVLTWTSLLVRDRPSVYAVGGGNSIEDKSAAEIATKLIEFDEQDLRIDDHIASCVYNGCVGGTAGIKLCYHQKNNGDEDFYLKDLTVFDYFIDNSVGEDIKKTPWIIFRNYISAKEAKRQFKRADLGSPPGEENYYDGQFQSRRGVPEYEFWMKPCDEYEKGFYARIVGNKVVDYIPEYPFTFVDKNGKEEHLLPAVFFKCYSVRGNPYGSTFITDCVPLQSGLNEVQSRLFKLWRQTSNVHRLLPKALQQSIDDENSIIFYDDPETAEQIRFTEPPPIPPIYQDLFTKFEEGISDVSGISETTTGQQESASKSGRAILYQAQLDQLKTQDAVKSLEDLVSDLYKLLLKKHQKFDTLPKLIDLFDDETMTNEIVAYDNSRIGGVDVRLQPRSGNETMQASKEQDAMERLQQGLISPSKADSLVGSVGSQLNMTMANTIIKQYLENGTVDIDVNSMDPETMVQAIEDSQRNAMLNMELDNFHKLQLLKNDFVGHLMQQGQAAHQSTAPNVHNTSAQAVSSPATAPNVFGPQAGKPTK